MSNKKIRSLLFGVIGLLSATSLVGGSFLVKQANGEAKTAPIKNVIRKEAARDYSGETDVPAGQLSVSATSSAKTSLGQSFSLMFSTGGQGFCDITTTYLLAPNDDGFDAYYAEFSKLTAEEREAITEQWEAGEYETVHFNSYVYSITGTSSAKDVYVPRGLTRNHIFTLDVTEIGINAVTDWTNVQSIAIPKEVTHVFSDSFQNVPEGMVFNVEAESLPEDWAEDWAHGAKVNYGYAYPDAKAEPLSKAGAASYGDPTQNFILGWYPQTGERYPLVAEYKVKQKDGSLSEVKYFDFSPTSSTSSYECVGYEIIDYSKSLNCDIPLNDGEEIDFDTFILHNIYRAVKNDQGKFVPDTEVPYRFVPKQMYSKVYDVTDFIRYSFAGLATFSGYTTIDVNIGISEENIYSHLKSNYYQLHKEEIENGSLYIRYRLTSLNLCSFQIKYVEGGEEKVQTVKISTPIGQYKLAKTGEHKVSFLLKNSDVAPGFNANSVREVNMVGLYISLDLMGAKSVVARSSAVTRFGFLSLMPYQDSTAPFNINLMLILIGIGYVVGFAAVATVLYFYLKNKYKNDEFRRMKTKKYITKALIELVGSLVVLFAIIFIILRATTFNNAIVVYNPIDAFIIVLSVLSVIIIGYFIKHMVGVVKTNKERRRILKLKLNEDVEDDGTN